ncbi:FadR family transcriptional regulator [Pseudomonas cavernicola]|uniref:FadR family transcriptional regulator n=1 Tax=Pseudomonas cavernicola TaxID=2320866 RepID=A0A418X947_9PSED|nr:FadR/GntR family transcriptional regulator [Pseudomonas cavernicola]RJG09015.1 FadR family transcriptional regulator [Pseudomonas cavernicola]
MHPVEANPSQFPQPEQLIGSVRATAAYELVVEQIRKSIFLGRFMPGDKLPPERDLAEQMLVSRTTIREAIRVLEGEGLVSTKRGAGGGLTVLQQNKLTQAEVEIYIEYQMDLLDSLFEFRIANEAAAARLAAVKRTDAHLEKMRKAVDAMDAICASAESRSVLTNISRFGAWDSEFHLAIAEASMNEYLLKAVEDSRAAMFLPVGKVFSRLEDRANEHHQEILQAIEAKDPDLAAEKMRQHLEATWESLTDLVPKARRKK